MFIISFNSKDFDHETLLYLLRCSVFKSRSALANIAKECDGLIQTSGVILINCKDILSHLQSVLRTNTTIARCCATSLTDLALFNQSLHHLFKGTPFFSAFVKSKHYVVILYQKGLLFIPIARLLYRLDILYLLPFLSLLYCYAFVRQAKKY